MLENVKVLIVEDNAANMELATDLLKLKGFQVVSAGTAETGIDMAKSVLPDLIIMDIGLPGIDGLAAASELKLSPLTCKIPIVATTSHAMKGDEEQVLASGCDGYIVKPIDTHTFADRVSSYLPGMPNQQEQELRE